MILIRKLQRTFTKVCVNVWRVTGDYHNVIEQHEALPKERERVSKYHADRDVIEKKEGMLRETLHQAFFGNFFLPKRRTLETMSAKCPPINLLRSSTLSRLEVSLLTGHKFWNVHHLLRAHLQSGALKFCCLMHTGWNGRYFFLLFMILHIWVLKVCCLVQICQNMLLFCLSHGLIQLLKGKSLFFVRHSDQINYYSGNICTKFTYYFSKFCKPLRFENNLRVLQKIFMGMV